MSKSSKKSSKAKAQVEEVAVEEVIEEVAVEEVIEEAAEYVADVVEEVKEVAAPVISGGSSEAIAYADKEYKRGVGVKTISLKAEAQFGVKLKRVGKTFIAE